MNAYLHFPSSRFVFRDEVFGGLLYNKITHESYLINKTGSMIISLFASREGITIKDIVEILKNEFKDADERILARDLHAFLDHMFKNKFLEVT